MPNQKCTNRKCLIALDPNLFSTATQTHPLPDQFKIFCILLSLWAFDFCPVTQKKIEGEGQMVEDVLFMFCFYLMHMCNLPQEVGSLEFSVLLEDILRGHVLPDKSPVVLLVAWFCELSGHMSVCQMISDYQYQSAHNMKYTRKDFCIFPMCSVVNTVSQKHQDAQRACFSDYSDPQSSV